MGKLAYYLLVFLAVLIPCEIIRAQPSLKGKPGISKNYAIRSARFADRSYKFAKLSYVVSEPKLAELSLDSAKFFIDQSLTAIDSAIQLAGDSELIALDLANISKQYANEANELIIGAKKSAGDDRISLTKDAVMQSANAVADAYHASMYFKGELKKKEPPTEKKDSVISNKVITKLDVDQTIFKMLIKDVEDKLSANKTEIERLKTELTKTKDPAKTNKFKSSIKKLEKENAELETKGTDARSKLSAIDKQINERDKTGVAIKEPEPAKGLHHETLDEWNKHLLLDTELPATLVYQVQVGMYKNKVLYEIFKGLTPVYGKTTPQGITYSIGLFEKLADANQAKDYVKSIGIPDAFVVAYYNKKRITPAEAIKFEKK